MLLSGFFGKKIITVKCVSFLGYPSFFWYCYFNPSSLTGILKERIKKMSLSLKSVAIIAMVTCILTTVTTTVVIAVVTTDNALSSTKKQQDKSINNCFDSGETNLVEMTNQMLTQKSEKIKAVIDGLLDSVRQAHGSLALAVQSIPPEQAANLDAYSHMDHMVAAVWAKFDISVFAQILIEPGIGYVVGDNSRALDLNTQLGYKHINSTTLIRAQGPPSAGTAGTLQPLRGGFYPNEPCNFAEIAFNFTGKGSGECPSPLDPSEMSPITFSLALPINKPAWTPSIGFASYTGVLLSLGYDLIPKGISKDGKPVGAVVAGFNLAGVNSFLKSQVAGDHERIFTVDGNAEVLGTTAGVSHGLATEQKEAIDPLFSGRGIVNISHPIHCTVVTDEVIRKSCINLYSQVSFGGDPFITASNRQRQSKAADEITIEINGTATEYFLLTNKLEDQFNLNWWINILILKDHVVGATRQRKLAAEIAITESNKDIDYDLNIGRIVLYCVIFGIAALLIILSIIATAYLTKPLEILSDDMGIVGELRLEDVNDHKTPSFLSEVRSMQASFKLMLEAMKEYRQYMPQAVVDRTDNTSDESEADTVTIGGRGSMSSRGTRTPIESGLGSATYKKPPNRWDVASSSSRTATSVYSKRMAGQQTALSLHLSRRKSAAHVTVGLRDWERFAHGNRDAQLIVDVHGAFLHCAIQDVKFERGLVERFVGDTVDVSFGGLLTCPAASTKAVQYSIKVRDRMQTFEKDHRGFGDDLTLVVGIASGSTLAGNLGCPGMKSPATLGRIMTVSKDLQQTAREIGLDIIICSRTDDDIKGAFASVPVDILKNTLGKKIQAAYLVGRDAAADRAGEWMYTMTESRTESIYDKAWSMVKQGQLVAGLDALNALRAEDIPRMVANRLTQYIDDTVSLTGKTPTEYFRMIRSHSQPGPVAELLYHAYQAHPTTGRAATSVGVLSPPELISPKLDDVARSRFDIQLSHMPPALRSPLSV